MVRVAPERSISSETGPRQRRATPRTPLLTLAARKAIVQRMLYLRSASIDKLSRLVGTQNGEMQRYRRELRESDLAMTLLQRGAGLAFARELPQGALLYLLVRARRPSRVVETGVRPGYSTAWILAALEANGSGELVSLGPGTAAGRSTAVENVSVGQFVPPNLRGRWTLALGNTEDRLREILAGASTVDLFLYDNGPDAARARFELRAAWDVLGPGGILLATHVDANGAWNDFCRLQGLPPQLLDPGPPPMGGLAVGGRGPS
jgi:predicted O-methyltransferase YrrM